MGTEQRKKDHIDICLRKDVNFSSTAGFENYRLKHCALPEIDLEKIDLTSEFLGHKFSYPFYISPITGGTGLARKINRKLVVVAQNLNIPMCVGSQRAAIEDKALEETFSVREDAPDAVIYSNIGAVQLNYGYGTEQFQKAIDMIKADALVLHLNPLQEAIQPEGDTNFSDLIPKIKGLVKSLDVPVIVKEVGHGISGDIAGKLESAGVSAIDVAGAGGTSWAAVEGFRRKSSLGEIFRNWGIPTTECIVQVKKSTKLPVIASGGIRNGIDIVKSLCLGASLCGIASPLLKPSIESDNIEKYFKGLIHQIKIAMFCCGAKNIKELTENKIIKIQ
ncbi:type 2 isopentenyl-diphosphate Delta-isomerase [Thermoproteota archaeon]